MCYTMSVSIHANDTTSTQYDTAISVPLPLQPNWPWHPTAHHSTKLTRMHPSYQQTDQSYDKWYSHKHHDEATIEAHQPPNTIKTQPRDEPQAYHTPKEI